MAAKLFIDGLINEKKRWNAIHWNQVFKIVSRLQARIVKAVTWGYCRMLYGVLSMLEPDEGKLSRPVLRGEGDSNVSDLPDTALSGCRLIRCYGAVQISSSNLINDFKADSN